MLTTHRIMIKKGIFRRKIYMPYNMIQDVNVSQGLLELFRAEDIKSIVDMNKPRCYWRMSPIPIK